jgi:hypothetical protein
VAFTQPPTRPPWRARERSDLPVTSSRSVSASQRRATKWCACLRRCERAAHHCRGAVQHPLRCRRHLGRRHARHAGDILDLTRRVHPYVDHEMDREWSRFVTPAAVTVQFRGGQTVQTRVDYPKGRPKNPMMEAEFAAKTAGCATFAARPLAPDTADRLIATTASLEARASAHHDRRVISSIAGRPPLRSRPGHLPATGSEQPTARAAKLGNTRRIRH